MIGELDDVVPSLGAEYENLDDEAKSNSIKIRDA